MLNHDDIDAMMRDLHLRGLDAEQGRRYDLAFGAGKASVVALLCAKYGADEREMLEALMDSRRLSAEANRWIERMEVSPEFIGYMHSGIEF